MAARRAPPMAPSSAVGGADPLARGGSGGRHNGSSGGNANGLGEPVMGSVGFFFFFFYFFAQFSEADEKPPLLIFINRALARRQI